MAFNRQSINVQIRADAQVSTEALKNLQALTKELTDTKRVADLLSASSKKLQQAARQLLDQGFSDAAVTNLKEASKAYDEQARSIQLLTTRLQGLQRQQEAVLRQTRQQRTGALRERVGGALAGASDLDYGAVMGGMSRESAAIDAALRAAERSMMGVSDSTSRLREGLVASKTAARDSAAEIDRLASRVRALGRESGVLGAGGAGGAGGGRPGGGLGFGRNVPTFIQFSLYPIAGLAGRLGAPGIGNAALAGGDILGAADALGVIGSQFRQLSATLEGNAGIIGRLARAGAGALRPLGATAAGIGAIAGVAVPAGLAVAGVSLVLSELDRVAKESKARVEAFNAAFEEGFLGGGSQEQVQAQIRAAQASLAAQQGILEQVLAVNPSARSAFEQLTAQRPVTGFASGAAGAVGEIADFLRARLEQLDFGTETTTLEAFVSGITQTENSIRELEAELRGLQAGAEAAAGAIELLDLEGALGFGNLTPEEIQNQINELSRQGLLTEIFAGTGLFSPEAIDEARNTYRQQIEQLNVILTSGIAQSNLELQLAEEAEALAQRVSQGITAGFTSGFTQTSSQIRDSIATNTAAIGAINEAIASGVAQGLDVAALRDQLITLQTENQGLSLALGSSAVASNDAAAAAELLSQKNEELARAAEQAARRVEDLQRQFISGFIQGSGQTTGATQNAIRDLQQQISAYNVLLAAQPELFEQITPTIKELQEQLRGLQATLPQSVGDFFSNPANVQALEDYKSALVELSEQFNENRRQAEIEQAIASAREQEDFLLGRVRAFEDYNRDIAREQEDEQRKRAKEARANLKRLKDFEDRLRDILDDLNRSLREAVGNRDALAFVQAKTRAEDQIEDLEKGRQAEEENRKEQLAEEGDQRDTQKRRREEDFRLRLRREDEDRSTRLNRLAEDLRRRQALEQQAYNNQVSALNQRVLQETGLLSLLTTNYQTAFSITQVSANNFVNYMLAQASRLNMTSTGRPYNPTISPYGTPTTTVMPVTGTNNFLGMTPTSAMSIAPTNNNSTISFNISGMSITGVKQAVNTQLDNILRTMGL